MCVRVLAHTCMHAFVCMCARVCTCIHAFVFVCVCVHIYVHIMCVQTLHAQHTGRSLFTELVLL